MSGLTLAAGWLPGRASTPVAPRPGTTGAAVASTDDARAALEAALLPALLRPPCVVQFSGGRDSSLVLAAAVEVARREGLAEPVAFTRSYPDLPETDERLWQEQVITHIGLRCWERLAVRDELDVVGPVAGASLRRHGLLWPALVHQRVLDFAVARGGSIVDGEGGDEIFGPGRLAPVLALLGGRARPDAAAAAAAALAVAPRPVRRLALRRLYRNQARLPWLTPSAWRTLERSLAEDHAGEPADWRDEVLRHPNAPGVAAFLANYAALAAEQDVLALHPLLDPMVLGAVAAAGGRFGFSDRTSAMVGLFGDLLPDAVLRRTSKARFNRVAFNRHSRAFVERWRGTGLDESLVDVEELRRCWEAVEPHGLSLGLLQAAWLAEEGRVADG